MNKPELTIMTVSYDSANWLRLNRRLVESKNPNIHYRWLVVENSPENSTQALAPDEEGFDVIPGPKQQLRPIGAASYHHGDGLNLGLQEIETRFALILDPDFFILEKHWITNTLDYMKRTDKALLGVPWHPSRPKKIRYFPCAHCLFIDLDRLDRSILDLSPDIDNQGQPRKANSKIEKYYRKALSKLTFRKRRAIGSDRDTGWHLYRQYKDDPELLVECFQAIHRPSTRGVMADMPFPDQLSFTPKQKGYFSTQGFEQAGLPDIGKIGWEVFLWQGRPFGFHVRCHPKRIKDQSMSLDAHYEMAKNLLALE
jgi:hypothetical protein